MKRKSAAVNFESYQSAQIGARETPKFRIGVFARFDNLTARACPHHRSGDRISSRSGRDLVTAETRTNTLVIHFADNPNGAADYAITIQFGNERAQTRT
jgi:hypothetical protein